MRRVPELFLVIAAAAVAIVPLPRNLIERLYSRGFYGFIQPRLTSLSNHLPIALFDVALIVAALAIVTMWIVRLRRSSGRVRTSMTLLLDTATLGALVYFWFLLAWGLNYQRNPLRSILDFREDRVTVDALRTLGARDIDAMNQLYESAHRSGWPGPTETPLVLTSAFLRTQQDLRFAWQAVAGRPKRSLLNIYFRRAAVDGMTDPFFLETLTNQGLLPFERPFVTAHEWAHLAGYADESEANFLAWLICLRGGAAEQYSAWLSIYSTVLSALPRDERGIAQRLQPGPRRDLQAISDRFIRDVNPAASRAGNAVYDRFLKANRVEAGIRSYSEVIRLLLGTKFSSEGKPVIRANGV